MGSKMRPSLKDLAIKYQSDKYYSHSYIEFYEQEFKRFRDADTNLLEIGIGYRDLMEPFVPKFVEYSSIKMWREYFSNAFIFACDIRPEVMVSMWQVKTYVIDQSKPRDLWKLSGLYDIIID